MQDELFPKPPPLVIELIGIPVPQSKNRKLKKAAKPQKFPNCHIPSKKNSKMILWRLANGRTLDEPILIGKPEILAWCEKAAQHIESTLLSKCLIEGEGIQSALTRLSATLSQMPADDSVNDYPQGSWSVELVPPGQEGAIVTIERL